MKISIELTPFQLGWLKGLLSHSKHSHMDPHAIEIINNLEKIVEEAALQFTTD